MQKKLLLFVLVLLFLFAAGCGGGQVEGPAEPAQPADDPGGENGADTAPAAENGAEGEVFELSLAHFFPATHPAEVDMIQAWAAELSEASGGRIKITSYPGETLLKGDEIYGGVVSGIADLGLSAFFYTRGRFPVLEVFELPGIVYESSYAASKVAWEGIKALDPAEVQDTRLMFVIATGPGDLMTTRPVKSLEDLKGMKIRAVGLSVDTLSLLGAAPEAMPQPDVKEAILRGIVEGNLAPVEVLQAPWLHAEVTDYLTRTPFLYNALFFVTMNLDRWNSLPPDLQEIFVAVSDDFHDRVAAGLWDIQNESALQFAVEETGQEEITLDPAEAARWISTVEPIQEEFVEKMNGLGFDGPGILETVKGLAEQY